MRLALDYELNDLTGSVERLAESLDLVLAEQLHFPVDDIRFMYDSFYLLYLAREYYYLPYDDSVSNRLKKAKRQYK